MRQLSLESFCESPDGSKISGFVGADFFYGVVQAEINQKELLDAEELRSSSKKSASSKKCQNEKKSQSGDVLYYCLVLHFHEGNCLQQLL